MRLNLSAEMLLLTQDPETGTPCGGQKASAAVAAAVLVELRMNGRVRERDGRVLVTDPTPTGRVLPDAVLVGLARASRPSSLETALTRVERHAVDRARRELLARGVVTERRTRTLGILPVTRWPDADPGPRADLRRRLDAAVLHHQEPDERTAALVVLIHGAKLHRVAFPDRFAFREFRGLKRRTTLLAAGSWADPVLRETLRQSTAMVAAANAVCRSGSSSRSGGGDGGDGGDGGGGE